MCEEKGVDEGSGWKKAAVIGVEKKKSDGRREVGEKYMKYFLFNIYSKLNAKLAYLYLKIKKK